MAANLESFQERAEKDLKRMAAKPDEGEDTSKKPRHRSPNYPAVGLKDALARTKKFYDLDGKAGATSEIAAKHIGFSTAHGEALSVLAALKSFGLVEDKAGRVVPTQRAIELLHLPENDTRRQGALRAAAITPPIYRQLVTQYVDGLPSDEALKAELVAYKGFNPKSVDNFISGFRETLDFAGLSDLSVIESEPEMATQETDLLDQPTVSIRKPANVRVVNPGGGTIPVNPPSHASANAWTWTLSIPRNVRADLRIAGDVTKADIARLKKQIEFLEESFEEEQGQ